jgi:ketol-acid reductoisomerase
VEEGNILDIAPQETLQELIEISNDLLKKAGLTDMNEKLKSF